MSALLIKDGDKITYGNKQKKLGGNELEELKKDAPPDEFEFN